MVRYPLSKKEKRKIAPLLTKFFGLEESTVKKTVVIKEKKGTYELFIVNDTPALIVTSNGDIIPHLKYFLKNPNAPTSLPKIRVDQGAVIPIGKGADLMAPGITDIEGDFNKGELAIVIAPNGAAIAIVRTLYGRNDMGRLVKGKVAKNIHHIGDKYWL